ncbi:MAG TPA: CHASE4 domain-containing protein, partial [Anaerolineaceae bacterium]|nr:CHASE4 domain-containing protein [Anaerolineaceae bacterium]
MSLRTKILLVNAATTVILIVGLLLAVRGLLLPHFLEEQDAAVHLNLERLEGAIQNDFMVLDQTIRDWAKWDDTYAFIQDANQEYVESNLQPATFADLHVHWMVFVGADGGVVFDGIYDPDSGQVQPS